METNKYSNSEMVIRSKKLWLEDKLRGQFEKLMLFVDGGMFEIISFLSVGEHIKK